MPKIPFASDQVGAEGARISHPWAFNNTGAAIAGVGKVISQEAAQWDANISAARDTAETAKVKTEMIKDKITALEDFDQMQDYANIIPKMKERQAENEEKYRGMISSPQLWNKLQPQMAQDKLTDEVHVRQLVRRKQVDAYTADYHSNVAFITKFAGQAPDSATADMMTRELETMTSEFVAKGIIGKDVAEKTLEASRKKIVSDRATMMIYDSPVVAKKALEQRDKEGNFTEFQGLTLEERGHKIREANSIITSMKETQNVQVKEVQRINMNTATDMVMSTKFEVNGKPVVMSRDQKEFQLDQMYAQKIPGTDERIMSHEDYLRLKAIIKPPKPEKDRVSLVPFTHQTDGDTIYVNKYDEEEVARVQGEGYKAGSVIKKEVVTKESKADKLMKVLGGDNTSAAPQGKTGTAKYKDVWDAKLGKMVRQ